MSRDDDDDAPSLSELIASTPLTRGAPDPWSVFKLLHDTLMAVDGITIGVALTATAGLYGEVIRKLGISTADALDVIETALAGHLPPPEEGKVN